MAKYDGGLGVVSSGATPDIVGQVVDVDYNDGREPKEANTINSTAKQFEAGVRETTLRVRVYYDPNDTGQQNLRDAFESGGGTTVQVLVDPIGSTTGLPRWSMPAGVVVSQSVPGLAFDNLSQQEFEIRDNAGTFAVTTVP